MPYEPQWGYAYWNISSQQKERLRQQGGINLSLRLYDVTNDIGSTYQPTQNSLEYICNETARDWYLPLPLSDRDYVIEIGYRCIDGKWLSLARSQPVRVPPFYPSDWEEDVFVCVPWTKALTGEKISVLPPYTGNGHKKSTRGLSLSSLSLASRVNGSVSSLPSSASLINPISSYEFPSGGSGIGMWASGSGSGIGMWASGSGSGLGLMSGAGFSRQFWLMANAKLTIYGATDPNAKVTIAGEEINLNADGTFSFNISFPDGIINCPITALSPDGQESRSISMKFERQTGPTQVNNLSTPEEASENNITESSPISPIQPSEEVRTESFSYNSEEDDISDWFPHIRR